MAEGTSEDVWLMREVRGSERQSKSLTLFEDVYYRTIVTLSSRNSFKTKDMSIEIEER